jgi:ABC-type multidrug transport system fused ATPase/permease subunit
LEGLLDTLAVGAALPLIGILVQPDVVESNAPFRRLHHLLGAPPFATFAAELAVAAVAVVSARALVSAVVQWGVQRYGADCQTRLARDLFSECIRSPYPWFLTRNAARLSRLFYDDVLQWTRGFVLRLMTITRDAITVALGAVLLLVVTPRLGIIILFGLGGLSLGLLALVRPRLAALARAKRGALDAVLLAASQALTGIKDVKLSSREEYFVELFGQSYRVASRTHASLNNWHQVVPLALPVFGLAGVLALVITQMQEANRGAVAAQVALLVMVSSRIIPALSQLSTSIGSLWNAYPYLRALHGLHASTSEARRLAESDDGREPWNGEWRELTLDGVEYTYPGSSTLAVRGASLRLAAGRAYGIAGRSGAGKSTLVDVVLRLLDPTAGDLWLDGRPLAEIGRRAWQARIGYVPQAPFIADDTLRANVAFGVPREQVNDARVRECLSLAHLEALVGEMERGLDTPLGDRGLRVSGGQRQRIAIARALYNQPRLLVLDEATSALDRISEGVIQEAVEGLRGHVTTLTIAHRLATIERCDTIFLLEEGRLEAQGTYAELLAHNALFRRMAQGDRADGEPAPALAQPV